MTINNDGRLNILSSTRIRHTTRRLLRNASFLLVISIYCLDVSAFLAPRFSVSKLIKRARVTGAAGKQQGSTIHHGNPSGMTGRSEGNMLFSHSSVNGEGSEDAGVADIMSRNQLMHAMLRVPDVNATVDYWISDRGAKLHSYAKTPKSETAFVGYGPDGPERGYFSLEITSLPSKEPLSLGNAVRYFGLSMLLDFDIKSTVQSAAGNKKPSPKNDVDPNGFRVRSVAAAPGDSFSRLCLRTQASNNGDDILSKTSDFYVNMLGMKQVAGDDSCVCVRYNGNKDDDAPNNMKRVGVATTLVFESSNDADIDYGNCFDHLAISTPSLDAAERAINAALWYEEDKVNSVIFMKPTAMFGTTIMGVTDPNGYKVYLVERPKR